MKEEKLCTKILSPRNRAHDGEWVFFIPAENISTFCSEDVFCMLSKFIALYYFRFSQFLNSLLRERIFSLLFYFFTPPSFFSIKKTKQFFTVGFSHEFEFVSQLKWFSLMYYGVYEQVQLQIVKFCVKTDENEKNFSNLLSSYVKGALLFKRSTLTHKISRTQMFPCRLNRTEIRRVGCRLRKAVML